MAFSNIAKAIVATYYTVVLPFRWLFNLVKCILLTGKLIGPVIIFYYMYNTLEKTLMLLDTRPWTSVRMDITTTFIVNTLFAVVLLFLLSFVPLNRSRKPRSADFVAEKHQPESPLIPNRDFPQFMVSIYGDFNGKWVRSGQAILYKEFLITANHVVENFDKLLLKTSVSEFELESSMFTHIEGDVAMLVVHPGFIQKLGLKSCDLVATYPGENAGLFCRAVGFDDHSYGLVKANPSFGFVNYTGSTIGGYSGAPYCAANKVYGMHLGGCSENLGYSSAYLLMLIKYHREDSDDIALEEAARQGDFAYQESPYVQGEYRVRIGNRLHLVNEDSLAKLKNTRARGVFSDSSLPSYERENAEVPPVAASILTNNPSPSPPAPAYEPQPSTSTAPLLITREDQNAFLGVANVTQDLGPTPKPSKPVLKRKLLAQPATTSWPQVKTTDGPMSMHVLRSEALASISKFSKRLRNVATPLSQHTSKKLLKSSDVQLVGSQLISLKAEIDEALRNIGLKLDSIMSTQPVR